MHGGLLVTWQCSKSIAHGLDGHAGGGTVDLPCPNDELQDAEKVQLSETSSKPKLLKPSIAVLEYQTPKESKDTIERIKPENCDGATTPTQKVPNALLRKQLQLDDGESSGSGITKSFAHIELQQISIKEKGLFTKGNDQRSLLESAPRDTEEALDFKENDSVDDVVVMDYAQPHRKPPIHNEKP
ncbi:hypothetical protein FNV43_RR09070 [Rhamnella rubrinervis]|uniref:Uncharacterized protein n=1 Tax=Rhamnella rubrinervis TaxID=2594499 RepID=A0A8K0MJM9_9ROSA|nr:hypothetical protein FNV43_RR09070 [Rhamnella rubrinervis]